MEDFVLGAVSAANNQGVSPRKRESMAGGEAAGSLTVESQCGTYIGKNRYLRYLASFSPTRLDRPWDVWLRP